jgi:hypothetical protein
VSITQVLSPGFSSIKQKSEVFAHIKTSFLYLLIPIALFIATIFLPLPIYNLVFTSKYGVSTAAITAALSIPYIIYTLGNLPSLFLLYTAKKPTHIVIANVIFFALVSIGCYYEIPISGVWGPPRALFAAFAIANIYLVIVAILEYRKLRTHLD